MLATATALAALLFLTTILRDEKPLLVIPLEGSSWTADGEASNWSGSRKLTTGDSQIGPLLARNLPRATDTEARRSHASAIIDQLAEDKPLEDQTWENGPLAGGGPDGAFIVWQLSGLCHLSDSQDVRLRGQTPPADSNPTGVELQCVLEGIERNTPSDAYSLVLIDLQLPVTVVPEKTTLQAAVKSIYENLKLKKLILVLPAGAGETSWIAPELGQTVFSHFAWQHFTDRGAANRQRTLKEWFADVKKSVEDWTLKTRETIQRPEILYPAHLQPDQIESKRLVSVRKPRWMFWNRPPPELPPNRDYPPGNILAFRNRCDKLWEQHEQQREQRKYVSHRREMSQLEAYLIATERLLERGDIKLAEQRLNKSEQLIKSISSPDTQTLPLISLYQLHQRPWEAPGPDTRVPGLLIAALTPLRAPPAPPLPKPDVASWVAWEIWESLLKDPWTKQKIDLSLKKITGQEQNANQEQNLDWEEIHILRLLHSQLDWDSEKTPKLAQQWCQCWGAWADVAARCHEYPELLDWKTFDHERTFETVLDEIHRQLLECFDQLIDPNQHQDCQILLDSIAQEVRPVLETVKRLFHLFFLHDEATYLLPHHALFALEENTILKSERNLVQKKLDEIQALHQQVREVDCLREATKAVSLGRPAEIITELAEIIAELDKIIAEIDRNLKVTAPGEPRGWSPSDWNQSADQYRLNRVRLFSPLIRCSDRPELAEQIGQFVELWKSGARGGSTVSSQPIRDAPLPPLPVPDSLHSLLGDLPWNDWDSSDSERTQEERQQQRRSLAHRYLDKRLCWLLNASWGGLDKVAAEAGQPLITSQRQVQQERQVQQAYVVRLLEKLREKLAVSHPAGQCGGALSRDWLAWYRKEEQRRLPSPAETSLADRVTRPIFWRGWQWDRTPPRVRSWVFSPENRLQTSELSVVLPPPPLSVMLLIDCSGSMDKKVKGPDGEEKRLVDLVRGQVVDLIDKLNDKLKQKAAGEIRLGIMFFGVGGLEKGDKEERWHQRKLDLAIEKRASAASEVRLRRAGQEHIYQDIYTTAIDKLDEAWSEKIRKAAREFTDASGMTPLYSAICTAFDQLKEESNPEHLHQVIVLSDGVDSPRPGQADGKRHSREDVEAKLKDSGRKLQILLFEWPDEKEDQKKGISDLEGIKTKAPPGSYSFTKYESWLTFEKAIQEILQPPSVAVQPQPEELPSDGHITRYQFDHTDTLEPIELKLEVDLQPEPIVIPNSFFIHPGDDLRIPLVWKKGNPQADLGQQAALDWDDWKELGKWKFRPKRTPAKSAERLIFEVDMQPASRVEVGRRPLEWLVKLTGRTTDTGDTRTFWLGDWNIGRISQSAPLSGKSPAIDWFNDPLAAGGVRPSSARIELWVGWERLSVEGNDELGKRFQISKGCRQPKQQASDSLTVDLVYEVDTLQIKLSHADDTDAAGGEWGVFNWLVRLIPGPQEPNPSKITRKWSSDGRVAEHRIDFPDGKGPDALTVELVRCDKAIDQLKRVGEWTISTRTN